MKIVTDLTSLSGRYVLLRSSLNIPLKEGKLRNRFRLERALPTMRYLCEQGARVILISHIGKKSTDSLQPVYEELAKYLPIHWGGMITTEGFRQKREVMKNGTILMAENLRQDSGEEANEEKFSQLLARQADIYINDAFAEAHRQHASVYGVAKLLPAYAGVTLEEEVKGLSISLKPYHPALFMLGGAKFATKLPLIEKYLNLYDKVFIGGALANDILKAQGFEIGKSLVSDFSLAGSPLLTHPKLLLPIDVIVDGPDGKQTKPVNRVNREEKILDCGRLTIDMLKTYIENAELVLWNGPFGAYELGYTQSTEMIAKHVAEAEGYSAVGGGDTVASIEDLHLNDRFEFLSIGGGAMLAFLEHGTTPALELLN
jgi:phosphoglycerate kinase